MCSIYVCVCVPIHDAYYCERTLAHLYIASQFCVEFAQKVMRVAMCNHKLSQQTPHSEMLFACFASRLRGCRLRETSGPRSVCGSCRAARCPTFPCGALRVPARAEHVGHLAEGGTAQPPNSCRRALERTPLVHVQIYFGNIFATLE